MARNDNDRHVYKDGDKWADKRNGASRPAGRYDTQQQAFEASRQRAENTSGGADVSIHGVNGKIREKNTYGKPDMNPPKG